MRAKTYYRFIFYHFVAISLVLSVFYPGICQGQNQAGSYQMEKKSPKPLKQPFQGKIAGPGGGNFMEPISNENGMIMVYIRMTDVGIESLNELMTAGAELTHVSEPYSTVTAFIHPGAIDDLLKLEKVLNVQKALKPLTNVK